VFYVQLTYQWIIFAQTVDRTQFCYQFRANHKFYICINSFYSWRRDGSSAAYAAYAVLCTLYTLYCVPFCVPCVRCTLHTRTQPRTLFYRQRRGVPRSKFTLILPCQRHVLRRISSSHVVVIREFKCQSKIEEITTIKRSSAFSNTDSKVYRSRVQTRRRPRPSSS